MRLKEKAKKLLKTILAMSIGLIIIALAVSDDIREYRLRSEGIETIAVVTDISRGRDIIGGTFLAVIGFLLVSENPKNKKRNSKSKQSQ